ncbi:hypothetical protein H4217_006430 [Coemansia sp. RSA 1939]|nr:hypothetical protein H4217_006430 [Coemansia sp. RSA 1939]KAJ2606146.1 hypothetical protein EV177_005981 [Coemansia sp. RSA 1804]KAJ2694436.1 hypothetical protein GGH99_000683 [Coemansia sp. RSA 1285]
MSQNEETVIISKDMLSKLPGVGDEEVSAEERELAKQIGHAFFTSLGSTPNTQNRQEEEDASIPESVGKYKVFSHRMPADQLPHKIDDSPETESKLNSLLNQKDLEHSLVVACAASVSAKFNDSEAVLADKPLSDGERVVFFLSGGGFASSDTALSKWYYLRMSTELGMRVFVSRYSVIPEHVFPRALHDVYTSYCYLIQKSGFCAQNIALVANSAGCNLALGALQLARMQGYSLPGCCVLISPLLDLTVSRSSWKRNHDRCVLPLVPVSQENSLARVYYGPAPAAAGFADDDELLRQISHPLVSPLFCDPAGFPPMQIQVGGDEVLLDEATEFAHRVQRENGSAELVVYPQQNHYTVLRGKLQLNQVYGNTSRFIDKSLG